PKHPGKVVHLVRHWPAPLTQRELNFHVGALDDESHRPLARLRPHSNQKITEFTEVLPDRVQTGVTMDDDRLVIEEFPARLIVPPDTPRLREGRGSPETLTQHFQRRLFPRGLVDRLRLPIYVRDEQD